MCVCGSATPEYCKTHGKLSLKVTCTRPCCNKAGTPGVSTTASATASTMLLNDSLCFAATTPYAPCEVQERVENGRGRNTTVNNPRITWITVIIKEGHSSKPWVLAPVGAFLTYQVLSSRTFITDMNDSTVVTVDKRTHRLIRLNITVQRANSNLGNLINTEFGLSVSF